eukprot:1138674-Pelagomonas_calceolata.AAC.4
MESITSAIENEFPRVQPQPQPQYPPPPPQKQQQQQQQQQMGGNGHPARGNLNGFRSAELPVVTYPCKTPRASSFCDPRPSTISKSKFSGISPFMQVIVLSCRSHPTYTHISSHLCLRGICVYEAQPMLMENISAYTWHKEQNVERVERFTGWHACLAFMCCAYHPAAGLPWRCFPSCHPLRLLTFMPLIQATSIATHVIRALPPASEGSRRGGMKTRSSIAISDGAVGNSYFLIPETSTRLSRVLSWSNLVNSTAQQGSRPANKDSFSKAGPSKHSRTADLPANEGRKVR